MEAVSTLASSELELAPTETSNKESGVDAFDRGEVDSSLPWEWVDDFIEERNHNDNADWLQISTSTREHCIFHHTTKELTG